MQHNELLTLEQVAERLELKPVTIKRYAREGLLDSQDDNGALLFEVDKVEKFKDIQSRLR